MSRHLSTCKISSKSMHAFLSNLANRQTDKHRGQSHIPPLSEVNYATECKMYLSAVFVRLLQNVEPTGTNGSMSINDCLLLRNKFPACCRRRCRPQNIWNMCVPSVHLWNESSNDDDLNVSASAKRLTPMKDSLKTVAKSRHLFISGITCNHPPRQKPFGTNPYDKKIPLCN